MDSMHLGQMRKEQRFTVSNKLASVEVDGPAFGGMIHSVVCRLLEAREDLATRDRRSHERKMVRSLPGAQLKADSFRPIKNHAKRAGME